MGATPINPKLVGLRLQEHDPYGNRRRHHYRLLGAGMTPRLDRITIGTTLVHGSLPEAVVQFSWHAADDAATLGRLRTLRVVRYSHGTFGTIQAVETHRIEYTYNAQVATAWPSAPLQTTAPSEQEQSSNSSPSRRLWMRSMCRRCEVMSG
jgi:hypothetical protein